MIIIIIIMIILVIIIIIINLIIIIIGITMIKLRHSHRGGESAKYGPRTEDDWTQHSRPSHPHHLHPHDPHDHDHQYLHQKHGNLCYNHHIINTNRRRILGQRMIGLSTSNAAIIFILLIITTNKTMNIITI